MTLIAGVIPQYHMQLRHFVLRRHHDPHHCWIRCEPVLDVPLPVFALFVSHVTAPVPLPMFAHSNPA